MVYLEEEGGGGWRNQVLWFSAAPKKSVSIVEVLKDSKRRRRHAIGPRSPGQDMGSHCARYCAKHKKNTNTSPQKFTMSL